MGESFLSYLSALCPKCGAELEIDPKKGARCPKCGWTE